MDVLKNENEDKKHWNESNFLFMLKNTNITLINK